MYMIEEIWNSSPNYNIPQGAVREFGRDNLIRALNAKEAARFERWTSILRRLGGGFRQTLHAWFNRMSPATEEVVAAGVDGSD